MIFSSISEFRLKELLQPWSCHFELRAFRQDRPYFKGVTVLQSGVPLRDLDCFFKAVRVNEPETPDRFLGFRKQELPVRIKFGQKVVGATLEADSFNIFVRRDAFLVPSHLENE